MGATAPACASAVAIARLLPRDRRGPVTLMGPREAPWRVRTAVPKALREDIQIIADTGPPSWRRLLEPAAIVLLGTPGDIDGPVAAQAMADGRDRGGAAQPEADARVEAGTDAVLLVPFVREPWVEAVSALLADPDRRTAIGHRAVAASTTWDEIAEALEVPTSRRSAVTSGASRPQRRAWSPTSGCARRPAAILPGWRRDAGRRALTSSRSRAPTASPSPTRSPPLPRRS